MNWSGYLTVKWAKIGYVRQKSSKSYRNLTFEAKIWLDGRGGRFWFDILPRQSYLVNLPHDNTIMLMWVWIVLPILWTRSRKKHQQLTSFEGLLDQWQQSKENNTQIKRDLQMPNFSYSAASIPLFSQYWINRFKLRLYYSRCLTTMETVGMVHEDDVKVVITVAYDQVMDSNPEFLHKDPIFGHKNEAFG